MEIIKFEIYSLVFKEKSNLFHMYKYNIDYLDLYQNICIKYDNKFRLLEIIENKTFNNINRIKLHNNCLTLATITLMAVGYNAFYLDISFNL